MRITITSEEYVLLLILLQERIESEDTTQEYAQLKSKLQTQFIKSFVVSTSKRNATKKATYTREMKAKKKIEKAVNLLRIEGKKITAYTVAKRAEVSFVTARKYSFYYDTSL